jgi:hypothetical protein
MAEKSNKRKHTGFALPRATKSYCKVCSGEWSQRKFQRLYKEFDELHKRRIRPVPGQTKKNKVHESALSALCPYFEDLPE